MSKNGMRERVIKLMELLKLTPAQFAQNIGVQRATIQHILSGRNEPSLKIIQAIHDSYPDVSLEWMMSGKGSAIPVLDNNPAEPSYPLFAGAENTIFPTGVQNLDEQTNLSGESEQLKPRKKADNKGTKASFAVSANSDSCKHIKEVVVFYNDGTYQKFVPECKK